MFKLVSQLTRTDSEGALHVGGATDVADANRDPGTADPRVSGVSGLAGAERGVVDGSAVAVGAADAVQGADVATLVAQARPAGGAVGVVDALELDAAGPRVAGHAGQAGAEGLVVLDGALGGLAAGAAARIDTAAADARRRRGAVAARGALALRLAAGAGRGESVADLAVETRALEAALDVCAFGRGVTRVGGPAFVDVDAETVRLGLLVAGLAVAEGLVVLGAAGAAAALDVLARIWKPF